MGHRVYRFEEYLVLSALLAYQNKGDGRECQVFFYKICGGVSLKSVSKNSYTLTDLLRLLVPLRRSMYYKQNRFCFGADEEKQIVCAFRGESLAGPEWPAVTIYGQAVVKSSCSGRARPVPGWDFHIKAWSFHFCEDRGGGQCPAEPVKTGWRL